MAAFRRVVCPVSIALIVALVTNLIPTPLGAAIVSRISPLASRAATALASARLPQLWQSASGTESRFTALAAPTTARVSPESGGSVETADGRIKLTFPSGATAEAVDVSITPLQPDVWGYNGLRLVNMFELKAVTASKKDKVSQFLKDVEISLAFSSDYNVKELAGLDVNSLGLYLLNETNGTWEPVSVSLTKQGKPELKAKTNHFSIYGSQAAPIIAGPGQVLGFESDLHTGTATTSIPIEVPQGPGGAAPRISLNYNSGSVDEMKNKRDVGSWVGIGWSLSTPSISYNPEKADYYLNIGSSYKVIQYPTGYYHTVPESYMTLKKTAWSKWEVWDRDGTYYLMDAARYYKDGDGTTWIAATYYRWDVTLIRDVHGNETTFSYDVDQVTVNPYSKDDIVSAYPLDITWGKNSNIPGSIDRFKLHFVIGTDGTRSSTWGWIRTDNPAWPNTRARVRENKHLDAIEVKQDTDGDGAYETLVRKYTWQYQTDTTGMGTSPIYPAGKMTLTSFQQVGANGTATLPAMSFTYSTPTTTYYKSAQAWNTNANPGNAAIFNWPHLATVQNGYGATVSYTYASNPTLTVDPPTQTNPPPPGIWTRAVVSQKSLNPGIGSTQTITYSYTGDPQYYIPDVTNYWKNEYRGFAQARATDAAGNYHEHWYYTTGTAPDGKDGEKLTGKEYKAEWRDSSNNLFKRVTSNWEWSWSAYLYTYGSNVYQVRLTWTEELQGNKTSRKEYGYDDYGNIVKELDLGDYSSDAAANKTADDTTVWRSFYSRNTTNNLENRPWRERLYEGSVASDTGGISRRAETFYYYDGRTDDDTSTALDKGDLTRVKRTLAFDTEYVSTSYAYDTYGNKTSEADANGNVRSWTWDSTYHSQPVTETYPSVNGLVMQESGAWDYGAGTLLSWTNANNITTSYEYDTFKRQTRVIKTGDSSGSPTILYNYNDWGAINQQNLEMVARIDGSTTTWSKQYFDGAGRVVQVQSKAESGSYTIVDKTTAFNNRGLVDKEYVTQKLSTLSAYQAPDAGWKNTSFTYDALGRVLVQTKPDGTTVSHAYTDWQDEVTSERGYKKRYGYDADQKLVQVEEFNDATPATVYATTRYSYNPLGNLVKVIDNAGNVTTMAYDALSRKTAMSDPDMGDWTYDYDPNGNLVMQTDNRGQGVAFRYDALNRLTSKLERGTAGTANTFTFRYDAFDTGTGQYGRGQRTGMVDVAGTVAYKYDTRGRMIREDRVIFGTTYTTQYTYDGLDRVLTVTYPTGEVVTQTYSGRGLPDTLTAGSTTLVSSATYNQLGQVSTINLGNSVITEFYYHGLDDTVDGDPASYWGKPYRIKTYKAGTELQYWKYWWDASGNVSSRKDQKAGETETFSYDFLDRLTGVSGPYGESYAYDTIGNMTSKNSVAYTYGARPHAVLFVGNYALAYDANGNMTERNNATGSQVLSWNISNQLAKVEGVGGGYTDTTTFVYDCDGRRIAKTAGTTTTVYPNKYYEKTGTEVTTNYYLGDRLVAVKKGSALEYIHQDHLGSTSVSSNGSTGAETSSNKYLPFGGARSSTGTLPTDKKFTGQRLDGTGLYFYNARYYDPEIGRFISPDTKQDWKVPDSLNRYNYVHNNPLKYIDSDGHFAFLAVLVVVLIVANYGSIAYDAYEFGKNPTAMNLAWFALDFVDPTPGGASVAGKQVAKNVAKNTTKQVARDTRFAEKLGKAFAKPMVKGKEFIAHHVLPVEFAEYFVRADLDINDTQFGTWVEESQHKTMHNQDEYNQRWREFFIDNPNASREDMLKFATDLGNKLGFEVHFNGP